MTQASRGPVEHRTLAISFHLKTQNAESSNDELENDKELERRSVRKEQTEMGRERVRKGQTERYIETDKTGLSLLM